MAVPIRIGSISLNFPDCLFGEDRRWKQSGARLVTIVGCLFYFFFIIMIIILRKSKSPELTMPSQFSRCICLTKASSNCYPSRSYEKEFETCFGAKTEDRKGKRCNTCKNAVYKHRLDRSMEFYEYVDSNGKACPPGRRSKCGKRPAIYFSVPHTRIGAACSLMVRDSSLLIADCIHCHLYLSIICTYKSISIYFVKVIND